MPIQFPDFNRISFDEANPGLVGAERGQKLMQNFKMFPQELQAKILANQIQAAQAKYAERNAKAGTVTAEQHNMFDPQIWNSEIGLRGSQSKLAGSEANKNDFLRNNPEYISPEGMLIQRSIEQEQQRRQQQPTAPQNFNAASGAGMQAGGFKGVSSGAEQGMPQIAPGETPTDSPGGNPSSAQFSQSQYHPDALAYNPPNLQSPTGNPNLDNMWFKKYGMSPIMEAQMDLAKSQAQNYQKKMDEKNDQFNNESVFANDSTLNAHKFLAALKKSSMLERGAVLGKIPAGTDAAQDMDTAGNNMAAAATKLFQGTNAVHAADIALNQQAKANRGQNEDVSFDLAHGVIAKNDRLKERQQFYTLGRQLGLKPELMDSMFNQYETDRPYINPSNHMVNDAYKGTWRDYLKPEAINSFINGKKFIQPNNKELKQSNWSDKDIDSVKKWAKENKSNPAIKEWAEANHIDLKKFDKKSLYEIAESEDISLAELKLELKGLGAIK